MKWKEFLNQTQNVKSENQSKQKTELLVLNDRKNIIEQTRNKIIQKSEKTLEKESPKELINDSVIPKLKIEGKPRINRTKRPSEQTIYCGNRKLIIHEIKK